MPVRNTVIGRRTATVKKQIAYEFRREMTLSERRLWSALRANQLGGLHFRRQQVIDGYIADFYCHAAALIVEVDGTIHETTREYDEARTAALESRGFALFRVSNAVLATNFLAVLDQIAETARVRIQAGCSSEEVHE